MKAKTGDIRFDENLRFVLGDLTIVTGLPNHGKSIFLDQIAIKLAKNEDWRFGVFSAESFPMQLYFGRLIKRIVGKKFSKNHINEVELKNAKDWIQDNFTLILPEEGFSLDSILDKAEALVLNKGIKGLIIDPWNRIESTIGIGKNEVQFIVNQLTKIIEFAQRFKVHVFLVAHPTKIRKKEDAISDYQVPTLYDISGSGHFFNMAQNGITVYRSYDRNKTEIHVQKVKSEHLGKLGVVEYVYCEDNSRFCWHDEDMHVNWLAPSETNQAL